MKVKLSTLVNAAGTLEKPGPLARLCSNEGVPVGASFHLAKVMKAVNQELETYHGQRVALVKKHGTERDGQFSVRPEDAGWAAFEKEYNELIATETEVAVEPLPVSALEGVRVAPADLGALDWLIVEG